MLRRHSWTPLFCYLFDFVGIISGLFLDIIWIISLIFFVLLWIYWSTPLLSLRRHSWINTIIRRYFIFLILLSVFCLFISEWIILDIIFVHNYVVFLCIICSYFDILSFLFLNYIPFSFICSNIIFLSKSFANYFFYYYYYFIVFVHLNLRIIIIIICNWNSCFTFIIWIHSWITEILLCISFCLSYLIIYSHI